LRVAVVVTALLLSGPGARGQSPAPVPWGLFSVRYDTRTSDFIYAVYGYGDVFGVVAVLHNPRSDYSEVLGGVGRNFHLASGEAQTAAVSVSRATDAWYAQLYYLPAIHRGALWLRATSELYLPLERTGSRQFSFSPLAATFVLSRTVEAGVGTDLSLAENSKASVAAGPEIRFAVPKATLGVDVQKDVSARGGRLRAFFLAAF
jgi:hypothetical protein